jgi:hypothetical protein
VNDETVLVGMGLLYTVGATFDVYKGSQGTMSSRRSPSVAATAAARVDEASRDECAPASCAEQQQQNTVSSRPLRVKGLPLYMRRSYRVELVRTALKPSTANCLLRLAGLHRLPPGAVVVDPCAGELHAPHSMSSTLTPAATARLRLLTACQCV